MFYFKRRKIKDWLTITTQIQRGKVGAGLNKWLRLLLLDCSIESIDQSIDMR